MECPTEREDKEIWTRNLETKWEKWNSSSFGCRLEVWFGLVCFFYGMRLHREDDNREVGFPPTSHSLVNVKQKTQIPWVLLPSALASLNPLLNGPPTWVFLGGFMSVFYVTQINLGAQLLTSATRKQTFLSSMFFAFVVLHRAGRLFQWLPPHSVTCS